MKTLICGPMYSGKSTALFQRLERCLFARKKVLLIRPKKDDRGYFTHSGGVDLKKLEENFRECFYIEEVESIGTSFLNWILYEKFEAVFVDEYFMIPGAHQLCYQNDYNVYFSGLLADSDCKLFEETIKILPFCEKIKKLNSVCQDCGSDLANYSYANFNKTSAIEVGDSKYLCLCAKCYNQRNYLKSCKKTEEECINKQ